MTLLLAACGGGGFNPEKAAKESKQALKDFFSLYENGESIASLNNGEIKNAVDKKMIDYFTDDFKKEVYQAIDNRKEYNKSYQSESAFFLNTKIKEKKTTFRNIYEITDYRINEEQKQVLLRIDATESTLRDSALKIEMVLKDGGWKINKVS